MREDAPHSVPSHTRAETQIPPASAKPSSRGSAFAGQGRAGRLLRRRPTLGMPGPALNDLGAYKRTQPFRRDLGMAAQDPSGDISSAAASR